jgi:hypothetical protein
MLAILVGIDGNECRCYSPFMLPDFPKSKRDITRLLMNRMRNRFDQDPILGQIKRMVQHEGKQHLYEQVGTGMVSQEYQEVSSKLEIPIAEIPTMKLDGIVAKIDAAAEEMLGQMKQSFFKAVGEASSKAGNDVDSGGQPFSSEKFLEAIEKVQMEFDKTGQPSMIFVTHPDMTEQIQKEAERFENEPELKKRHEEILRKQHAAWTARENNRQLVD